ncbi:MAG: DUF4249 family protein [Lepagella sp.]
MKKMIYGKCLIAVGVILLVAGCGSDLTYQPVMPVIEGWIGTDEYPEVIFTATVSPEEKDVTIADKVIRWGKVTISDGENEVILTGDPEFEYMPPYRYITNKMKGEVGKTYRIVAEYEDLYASAECRMLPPTPIQSITFSPIEGNDTLRSGELTFISPEDTPAYYYVTMGNVDERSRPLPTMMGVYKAEEPGKTISIPLFNPKNKLDGNSFVPQLRVGDNLEITLCRVTEEVYEFWKSYDNAMMFGASQFLNSAHSVRGNIRGGLGVWSVQGTTSQRIQVQ